MRRYWTRWLLPLAALLLIVGGLLFRGELSLRYRVGQALAALPVPAGASLLDRRSIVDTTCGAAGTVTRYTTDRPWEEVAAFFERYARRLPWQGGSWTADALDFYWPFSGDELRELRLNIALDRGNPYIIPALVGAYDGAPAKRAAPTTTTYLVQIAYAEDKTVSALECARRHNADTLAALASDLRRCVRSFPQLQGCVRD
jgi:hypothetical protein